MAALRHLKSCHQSSQVWAFAGHMQTNDDKPTSLLLAMDPNTLQLVWDSCSFSAKAALACTCRKLQQKSQAWQSGSLPSHRWQEVGFHWWLKHRKLSHWNEFVVQTNGSMGRVGDYEAAKEVQASWEPAQEQVMTGPLPGVNPAGCRLPFSGLSWVLRQAARYLALVHFLGW